MNTKIATWVKTATKRFLVAALVSLLAIAGLAVPNNPFVPEAEAQVSASQTNMGDCDFRRGTGSLATLGQQLCWIDWTGLTLTGGQTKPVSKKFGRYTMTATIRIVNNDVNTNDIFIRGTNQPSFQPEKAVFANPVNGNTLQNSGIDTFIPYGSYAANPIIDFAVNAGFNERDMMVNLENIVIKDEKGNIVPNYSIMMMDAASTYAGLTGELISMENDAGAVDLVRTITPTGFYPACSNTLGSTGAIYGAGTEPNNWGAGSGGRQRDFICYPRGYTTTSSEKPGSFIVTAKNPKNLEFGMYTASTGFQSIALAIDLGRLTGSLKPVNTSFEQGATGQATVFDFKAYDRVGTTDTEVPLTSGQYTTQLRTVGSGGVPQDSYVYKSVATGPQANFALKRYEPIWTCKLNESTTVTVQDGSPPPAGFTLKNTESASELIYTNPDNVPVNCTLEWKPRFQPAPLNLSKVVEGSARLYDDVNLKKFDITYTCRDYNGYAAAYPSTPLTSTVSLPQGDTKIVNGLPKGMNCTVKEADPQPGPGETHTLGWTGGTQSGSPLPTASLSLADSNSVVATNTYEARTGTLHLSKELVGDPMGEIPTGVARPYQFEITCAGTPYKVPVDGEDTSTTINIYRTGTVANGSIDIPGIPVGRDCALKPLTGLTPAEGKVVKFDGRDVTYNGSPVNVNSDGTYTFKLADYPAGGTPTSGDLHIVAKYSYLLRDVRVLKELGGAAAADPDVVNSNFSIAYRCDWGNELPKFVEGTLQVPAKSPNNFQVIPNVPVSADCKIYESGTPALPNVTMDKTEIKSADANDKIVTLTNDQAKTTPILKVNNSLDPAQNRVVVTNFYSPKLGTVALNKVVNTNGITSALPNAFSFVFNCGSRSVLRSDGTVDTITLSGKMTVDGGTPKNLVLNTADGSAVNDQAGDLGVPYGNTCTFTEDTPDMTNSPGIVWTTDDYNAKVLVSAPTNTATVTNTFKPLGSGLTIKQDSLGYNELSKNVTYNLTCTNATGTPIDLGTDATFTLTNANGVKEIPSAKLPKGSRCTLTETSTDDRTRPKASGGTFPIVRNSTATYDDGTTATNTTENFANPNSVKTSEFVIGDTSIMSISHDYEFIMAPVDATKQVAFDAATEQFISDARKQVKRERNFGITLTCVGPLGGDPTIASGTVSSDLTAPVNLGTFQVGTTCTATELSTTTADGIKVVQQVTAGGKSADTSVSFDVVANSNPVVFTNTYSRILAKLHVKKTAQLPGSIVEQYKQAGKDITYHTHNFTLECHDPETGSGDAGAVLGTFNKTIYGPGETTFDGVPVGADCKLTGDHFGDLKLDLTDSSGDQLTATLRPKQVRWVVDKNDGTAWVDTDLADGATTSQYFHTLANAPDNTIMNEVELVNTYDYVTTKIKMTKDIVGKPDDLKLLTDTSFEFSLQCKGVGYTFSQIGMGTEQLKDTLAMPDFKPGPDVNGNATQTYTSPEVIVPTGSLCTFDEIATRNLPSELINTPTPAQVKKTASTTEWVDESSPVVSYDFDNVITRRTTPVNLAFTNDGFLTVADPAGYTASITCNDPAATKIDVTLATNDATIGQTVASDAPLVYQKTVNLPVGASCTFDMSGSPALAAHPLLEENAGDRKPFSQFNSWLNNTGQNTPAARLSMSTPVDASYKTYKYDFTVPGDAPSDRSILTVGAETYFPQDHINIAFTKNSMGKAGTGTTFTFSEFCTGSGTEFTLQEGQTYILKNVPVSSKCAINEIDDGVADSESSIEITKNGAKILNPTVQNVLDPDMMINIRSAIFDVQGVDSATDMTNSSPDWSLTMLNRFNGLEVDKKIDGTVIGSVMANDFDTTLLPHTAETMKFHYTATNSGAFVLRDLVVTERGLAGMTVIAPNGTEVVIPDDGIIPATVCDMVGTTLNPGESKTCSFDVKINAPHTENFYYSVDAGKVLMTAQSAQGQISSMDKMGAFRPMDSIAWLLPETGMQTLVYVLLLGLLVLGYGVYRWKRERDREEAEEAAEVAAD